MSDNLGWSLPPGVSNRDIDGRPCPQCGQCGCDCEEDDDPRSYRQRVADEKDEHLADLDREEKAMNDDH